MSEPLGLFRKYIVQHGDGRPVDDPDQYFVLKVTDAHARVALRVYAEHVRRYNPILSRELIALCEEYDGRVHDARQAEERARRNGHGGRR